MAAGELVSVRAQQEMVDREVQVERQELAEDPEGEKRELAGMYRAQGLSAEDANTVARILSANPDIALDTHARLELGVDPQAPGSAWRAAISSFLAFAVGAILPLFPWFFTGGTAAVIASVIIGAIAALALGATIGLMSGRNVLGTAVRQLAVAAVAAGVTYGVGSLLGVSTSLSGRPGWFQAGEVRERRSYRRAGLEAAHAGVPRQLSPPGASRQIARPSIRQATASPISTHKSISAKANDRPAGAVQTSNQPSMNSTVAVEAATNATRRSRRRASTPVTARPTAMAESRPIHASGQCRALTLGGNVTAR